MPVELNGLAGDRRISRIMRLPEAITQDRGGARNAAATAVVGSGKSSPNDSPDAECTKKIAAHLHAVDELAFSACRQVESRPVPGKDAGKDVLPVAQGFPQRVRDP